MAMKSLSIFINFYWESCQLTRREKEGVDELFLQNDANHVKCPGEYCKIISDESDFSVVYKLWYKELSKDWHFTEITFI